MQIGIFTNEVYDILGFSYNNRVIGFIVKTKYSYVYRLYKYVNLPLYHLRTDKKQQFIKKQII